LAPETLGPGASGAGTGDVDQRLRFLPYGHDVDHVQGREADDVHGVAVLVDDMQPRVICGRPQALRLNAARPDRRKEGRRLCRIRLDPYFRLVGGSDGEEDVGRAIDDGVVGMVGFRAGGE
jgi:hypothetical protein